MNTALNEDFLKRCIKLWQVIYKTTYVERNKVNLFLAKRAYAEIALYKEVDWSRIKASPYTTC